jgi:Dyp-type peroxidase family
MANLYELTKPICQETLQNLQKDPQNPLESLQGNILHGHGRDRSISIFLSFKAGKMTSVKEWIKSLAKRITSAQRQLNETVQYRQCGIPGRLFMSFLLSAKGYGYLGFNLKNQPGFEDPAFRFGMQASQHRLNDPHKDTWEEGYQKEIHAMVLLADNDEPFLLRQTRELLNDVEAYAEICAVEHGRVMRNTQQYPVEHFGYVDSGSQPLFFQNDIEREGLERDGTHVWHPGNGPDLVLVKDPYGRESDCGSYLVFRKLEQRVRDFKEHEQKLARALGLTGEDTKRAGALVMGRFEDGTPVVLHRTAGGAIPVPNNFNYDADPHGQKCPFQAHIRMLNPRRKGVPRIVRRGITYGKREKEPKDHPSLEELPSEGVGLLFMCYQRNIEKQFEALQYLWASDPRLPLGQEPGIDPVIGQPSAMGVGQQKWPIQWGDPREKHKAFNFHGFVTLKGGEYFFAPSIHFLENI